MDKFKVEEGTVQETLMMPLYGRVYCEEPFQAYFQIRRRKSSLLMLTMISTR